MHVNWWFPPLRISNYVQVIFFLRLVSASAEESHARDPVQSQLLIGHHNTVEIRHLFKRSGQQMFQTSPNKKEVAHLAFGEGH